MELANKEKEILDYLKKNGKSVHTNIAFGTGCSTTYAKYYLESLEKKGLIIRIEEKKRIGVKTLWALKSDDDKEKKSETGKNHKG